MKLFRPMAAAALWAAATCTAAVLPTYYPESFKLTGTIDRLDVPGGEIVISDKLFRVTNGTQVHLLTRQSVSLNALSPGMYVGVDDVIDGAGQRTATVIYELPDDYLGPRGR